ncbi:MAG: aminotransferase class V-fold PLP-dependent enzyme [Deltaproteobacteria bacterium]|nr:aminotransferase class V-fold PLP-dependent enzyme [Deltaproteobacteria bacterium]
MNIDKIRSDFPFFKDSNLIYFDNATTTQKPEIVLAATDDLLRNGLTNAWRGSHMLANKAAMILENVRTATAKFIGGAADEIAFTPGSTYSMNTLAYAWGLYNLEDGDEILLCYEDHKSTILPWLELVKTLAKFGKNIKVISIPIHPHGDYDDAELAARLTPKTRVIILTHIHSYFGTEMNIALNIAEIRRYNKKIKIFIDGTGAAGHIPVDVGSLGCDAYLFTGHKMCALPGVGILWISKDVQHELQFFIFGANPDSQGLRMLESGTYNMPAIVSLGAAIKYIEKIGLNKIEQYISDLTRKLANGLNAIPGLIIERGASLCKCQSYGICTFGIEGMTGADISYVLNEHKIYVRADNFCFENSAKLTSSVRASLYFYNTENEVENFIRRVQEMC